MKIPDLFFNPKNSTVKFETLGQLISLLVPNLIMLAGIIFFLLILYYGWRLVENAGGEQGPQQIHKAQQAVTYSLIGFILVVGAFFIMQIIGTLTGIDFTNPASF